MRTALLLLLVLPLAAQAPAPLDLRAFYAKNCVRCHGADGTARDETGKKLKGQDFTNPDWISAADDKGAVNTIRKGKFFGLAMPAYKDSLNGEQAQALVTEVLRKVKKDQPIAAGGK